MNELPTLSGLLVLVQLWLLRLSDGSSVSWAAFLVTLVCFALTLVGSFR